MPHFENASKYKLSENFNFFSVNCENKAVCEHFGINRYPTLKTFFQGEELNAEPGRDLESTLEFVDKLNSTPLIEITSKQAIPDFKRDYGESSPIAAYDNKDSNFFKCLKQLAEDKYKPNLYFGIIQKEIFDKNLKFPSLIVINF